MGPAGKPSARFAAAGVAALACLSLLAPGTSLARATRSADGLSARLATLAQPTVRDDSPAAQAARLHLAPSGPGSLLRDGDRVLAEVRFDHGAAASVAALRAAGVEVVHVSRRYQTVTVAVLPSDLQDLAAAARVEWVDEVLAPVVRATDCGGAVRSEGDGHLDADVARAIYGVDGSGVTVGVLSDSFNRDKGAVTDAGDDVASGDLPGPGSPCGSQQAVSILSDPYSGADEGRAMAQIVHDLAPGATIKFATAFSGEAAFADNIRALWKAGADVIVDDVGYYEEPFFQDGPIAVAVDEVAAAGVSYFSSAGNDNLFDASKNEISSWEAPGFRDGGACPGGLGYEHCMDFDPGVGTDRTFGLTVAAGATLTVDFQWAEPWEGVESDLDVFLLDNSGNPLKSGSTYVGGFDDNIGGQRPVEFFRWTNSSGSSKAVQLAINHCFGTCNPEASAATPPRLKVGILQNGFGVTATEYPQSAGGDTVGPTIFGHTAAAGAISTGAVRYNTTSAPESFSSRGPTTILFGPVTGTGAAAALPEPEVRSKPDLAATDGGANTFFGSLQSGVWRFYGTSAAAPHAAAVAALVRDGNPAASAAEVREALLSTSRTVGTYGAFAVGAGLVDADAAVGALYPGSPPGGGESEEPGEEPGEEPEPPAEEPESSEGEPPAEEGTESPPFPPAELTGTPKATTRADTSRPQTWIAAHPRRLVRGHWRTARVHFRFRANEAAVFFCRFDSRPYRRCGRRVARRFGRGSHVVRVRARDLTGNLDRSPAVFRFRVRQVR